MLSRLPRVYFSYLSVSLIAKSSIAFRILDCSNRPDLHSLNDHIEEAERIFFEQVISRFARKSPMATNVTWHKGVVTKDARYEMLKQKGATVWLTGLSGSGKSTVSVALEQKLFSQGYLVYRLDGDNIRHGLNSNLGFSAADRKENIRRISEVAKLMGDIGVISTTAFISPYAEDREIAREIHAKADIPFVEVYVECPLDVAEQRDPKGLYKKARRGEIKNFTGIDDPYESPVNPEIVVNTSKLSVEECADKILHYLTAKSILMKKIPALNNHS